MTGALGNLGGSNPLAPVQGVVNQVVGTLGNSNAVGTATNALGNAVGSVVGALGNLGGSSRWRRYRAS